MPGFDGTGPAGQGPMTGGGRGYCVQPNQQTSPRFAFSPFNWFRSPYTTARPLGGRGMGRGMGRGRGRGRW